MKKYINNICLLFLSVTLSACGLATPSDPIEIDLDETPPSITQTSPLNKGVLGYNDNVITLKVNENVAADSLAALNSLEIKTGLGVNINGTWAIENNYNNNSSVITFTLTQRENIPAEQQFSININGEVTDEAGNPLVKTLQFKTPKLFNIDISATGLATDDSIEVTLTVNGKNANDIKIEHNNINLNIAKLEIDDAYFIEITQQPEQTFCSISGTSGVATDANIKLKCHNVLPVINEASNWNQYQNLTHGGELRRVTFQGPNSCKGLTGKDILNAFDWQCSLEENGALTFTSTGLKPEKHLSNLINFGTSPGWKNNQLKVTNDDESVIYETISNIWWSNPVTVIDANIGRILKTKGTVYLMQTGSPTSRHYLIKENEIAFLIDPSISFSPASSGAGILVEKYVSRTWIEGKILAHNSKDGIKISHATLTVLRNVIAKNAKEKGINVENSDFTTISNSQAIDNKTDGIYIGNSYYVKIHNSTSLRNTESGLVISTNKATITNFKSLHNNQNGIIITGNDNNLINSHASNNRFDGLVIAGADKNIINMMTLSSNGNAGLRFIQTVGGRNNAKKNLLSNLTISNNTSNSILFELDALYDNRLINVLDAYNDIAICLEDGCDDVKNISSNELTLEALFAPIASDSHMNISASAHFNQIYTLNTFDNPYRVWGAVSGTCNTVNITSCKLFDWSLNSTNNTYALNQLDANAIIIDSHTFSASTSVQFLSHSIEIIHDEIGNDNGLCEENESCIFTPNIGSYQGHGELEALSNNENGLSVQMFKYKDNGR